MPMYRVELIGAAPVSRTVIVEAATETEARKRARAVAKGEIEVLPNERHGTWEITAPPRTIHTTEATQEEQ